MAKAKFNENGILVNAETGEPIGTTNGNTTIIDSVGAEMKTLEDYGVLLPDFPDEESSDNGDVDDDFSGAENGSNHVGVSKDRNQSKERQPIRSHIDNGVSSFKVERTKYEVTSDSYFIVRFGLVQKEDGRFVPIKEESVQDIPSSELHWVKFRMWTYDEELSWKSECLEYNSSLKVQQVNLDKLNEKKIRSLMLDWSFGEYADRLKLLHCDGMLSDESYLMFKGLYPSIATTIVDLMNLVLENNQ